MIDTDVRSRRWLLVLGITGAAMGIWLFVVARPLLDSLVVAGLLGYLLDPATRVLQRRGGFSRSVAAAIVFMLTLAIIGALVAAAGAFVWDQLPRVQVELLNAWYEAQGWLDRPVMLLGITVDLRLMLANLQRAAGNAIALIPGGSANIIGQVTSNLLWTLVTFVSLFYFLKDGPRIKPWIISLLPSAYRPAGRELLDEIDRVWGAFLRMQLLIFLILLILIVVSSGLILWTFHRGWLPLSPLGLGILLVIVYTAIQQIDNLWLRPQLLGSTLHLHPGVVFVALIAALALSGLLGALVIVPVIATLKVIGDHVRRALTTESTEAPEQPTPQLLPATETPLTSVKADIGVAQPLLPESK